MIRFSFASDFWHAKTTWTAITAIVTALAGYLTGELNLQVSIGMALAALLAAFNRDATAKNTEAVNGLVMTEDDGTE